MRSKLDEIVAHKRSEIAERKARGEFNFARASLPPAEDRLKKSLLSPGIRLIAEIKPKSPSAGDLRACTDIEKIVDAYDSSAAGISVLTDEKYFGGSMSLLAGVTKASTLPVLCKEFILDEAQITEARLNGAEAVLLIVKILNEAELQKLLAATIALNMTPVVEIQNSSELEAALHANAEVLLINNRNLETFETDLATTEKLAPSIPESKVVISASGIDTRADIDRLLPLTNKFLVGSSLMRCNDIPAKLRELCC